MRMRLTDSDLEEIIYERHLPFDFKSENGLEERHFNLDYRFGNALINEHWFEGIHINEGLIQLRDNLMMRMESTDPIIEMHFSLAGSSTVSIKGRKQKFVFESRRHNIFYMPHFDGYLESGRQNESNHNFEVHLSEPYFKRLLHNESALLNSFAEKIEKKEMAYMSRHNPFITAKMDGVVKEIIHCKKAGMLKRMFLESKVLELLILQVEQFEGSALKKECSAIKAHDLDKLQHAKYLLEQNISDPASLMLLAQAVGINEFKLKKGFKEVFGNTVFGYLHDLRMDEARRLLSENKSTITEIAEYCGYEYSQHFSTAFKKRFGMSPAKFRA